MREPGWYWVKRFDGWRWDVVEFGTRGVWCVPGHFEPDGYFEIVGPRIEEPKGE